MARLSVDLKLKVLTVAPVTGNNGREYFQVVGRHNGETLVIGCGVEDLPDEPEKLAGTEQVIPITVKGDRLDLWVRKAQ